MALTAEPVEYPRRWPVGRDLDLQRLRGAMRPAGIAPPSQIFSVQTHVFSRQAVINKLLRYIKLVALSAAVESHLHFRPYSCLLQVQLLSAPRSIGVLVDTLSAHAKCLLRQAACNSHLGLPTMPAQYTLLGKPVPRFGTSIRIPKQFLAGVAILACLTLIFTLPSRVTPNRTLNKFKDEHHLTIPKLGDHIPSASNLNPFAPSAHAPPTQANSTNAGASWYGSLSWLSPFSSEITMDEGRALLPPLAERIPIYTYYDASKEKDKDIKKAQNALLLTWRRAWWAKGFKPMVLSILEAKKSPAYAGLEQLALQGEIRTEFLRWLAWESMSGGVLCHSLAFPMGRNDEDALLYMTETGRHTKLVRYDEFGKGLYIGNKNSVTDAIHKALSSPKISEANSLHELLPEDTFRVNDKPKAIAYYNADTVRAKYGVVAKKIESSKSKGLMDLNELINSHLHSTWKELFSSGIVVLKPLKNHMTAVLENAAALAELLAQCSDSPMPSSCPPNRKDCKPCVASIPLKTSTYPNYRNDPKVYTIGVLPHPWTTTVMEMYRSDMNIRFIRRETERDIWLRTVTRLVLGTGVSTLPRLVKVKEAVASPHGVAHSLWFTAEREMPLGLEWNFGFTVTNGTVADKGYSETPVPGPERRPPPPPRTFLDGPLPSEQELAMERTLFESAKLMGKTEKENRILKAVEAWNLADTEIWKFVKAFNTRRELERKTWDDEERKLTGGAGNEETPGWFPA